MCLCACACVCVCVLITNGFTVITSGKEPGS